VARQLGLEGKLRIDGKRAPPSTRVREGQLIEVALPSNAANEGVNSPPPAVVLRVGPDVVYADKPAGLPTHPLGPHELDALSLRVARLHPECADASEDRREGGAMHRLDVDTSGVVAFARHRAAWTLGRAAFSASTPHKRYLAVVELASPTAALRAGDAPDRPALRWPPPLPPDGLQGWIEEAPDLTPVDGAAGLGERAPAGAVSASWPTLRIRAPIGPGQDRRTCAVRLDGRRAISLVTPRLVSGTRALVEVAIETGVRHQVRVHLAWIGLPIVGDGLYGTSEPGAAAAGARGVADSPRLALHAGSLRLGPAFPGEPWVHSPVPDALADLLRGRVSEP